jgi:hypothetical protein
VLDATSCWEARSEECANAGELSRLVTTVLDLDLELAIVVHDIYAITPSDWFERFILLWMYIFTCKKPTIGLW